MEGWILHSAFLKIFSLLIKSFFLPSYEGWGRGGVIDIWPVKPFETVPVIKGYTNKMYELNWGFRAHGRLQYILELSWLWFMQKR